MKISIKVFIFSLLCLSLCPNTWSQTDNKKNKIEAFKSDINMANIDRILKTELYMEKISKSVIEVNKNLKDLQDKNNELEVKIKSIKEKLNNDNQEQLKKVEKRLVELESKTAKHDFDKLQTDHDSLKKDFDTLSKDYAQAKLMIEQMKLLLMTDYTSRFNSKGPSDNKLKGIIEDMNKIQLPKPIPTQAPTVTPSATPTPAATSTATSTTPQEVKKSENFIEKYSLPARQSFCRKPENFKQYQKECLPYL